MVYTETIKIPLKDVEKGNIISDRGLLEAFENVATHHSDFVHDGVNEIKTKGHAWVIMDWKVKVLSRPKYGGEFLVNTWSRENNIQDRKISTYRDFEMYDESGTLCVIATSKWIVVNIHTGKIANIDRELQERYEPETKSVFESWDIEKTLPCKESIYETEYVAQRNDVDFNLHMHNIYYMNLAYNTLPIDVYEARPFNNFKISYKREIKLGEVVKCKYSFADGVHKVTVYNKDETKVHSIITLYN